MIYIKQKRWPSSKEEKAIREVGQQPLDKSGYTNSEFDRRYGKKNNPFIGGERDRKFRKKYY